MRFSLKLACPQRLGCLGCMPALYARPDQFLSQAVAMIVVWSWQRRPAKLPKTAGRHARRHQGARHERHE
jgi:hypothetical protein